MNRNVIRIATALTGPALAVGILTGGISASAPGAASAPTNCIGGR